MQTITKYRAYNGAEFTSAPECEVYEYKCLVADRIIAQLPAQPKGDGCAFANGHGYIQHSGALFTKVRRELLEQAAKECDHKWIKQSMNDETAHPSWAGRIIDECCTENLRRAWYRIMCTDADLREWGQPYYAAHPSEARDQRQLN